MKKVTICTCLLIAGLFVPACGNDDHATLVRFAAGPENTTSARTLLVEVTNGAGEIVYNESRETSGSPALRFPSAITVRDPEGSEGSFSVQATLMDAAGSALGIQTVRSRTSEDDSEVWLCFHDDCNSVVCGDDERCIGGVCRADSLDPLPFGEVDGVAECLGQTVSRDGGMDAPVDVASDTPAVDGGVDTGVDSIVMDGGMDMFMMDTSMDVAMDIGMDTMDAADGGMPWLNFGDHFTATATGGSFVLETTRVGVWYDNRAAGLYYRAITGDFIVSTRVTVRDRENPSNPPRGSGRRLAGLMVRSPASPLQNYSFVATGTNVGVPKVEPKNTIEGISDFYEEDVPNTDRAFRICRVGSSVRVYHRPYGETTPWDLLEEYTRPDFPPTVQVGVFVAESSLILNVRATFDEPIFSVPASVSNCAD